MNTTQYTLLKIPFRRILQEDFNITLTPAEQRSFLVAQGPSLLLDQIERLRGEPSLHIPELILVSAPKNPKKEAQLRTLLAEGFTCDGIHYSRFGKSASQAKAGITAFVSDTIHAKLYQISQLDIPVKECVISRYEAQRCLLFSSCTLIKDYLPRIVIIGEYEKVLKDKYIRYVETHKKTITDKKTGEEKTVPVREIAEGLHDIKLSPFDGCGCHEIEFAEKISKTLGLSYTAVGAQVRLPFLKGYSVYVPFREIFADMGVSRIKDIYGNWHAVSEIDCIWNICMFKGHKLFLEKYGAAAFAKYMETLQKYSFCLGISKYSHYTAHLPRMARMNFQYLQCLDLWNDKYIQRFLDKASDYDILSPENEGGIIRLARYTTELFEKIIKGDKFYTCKYLGLSDTKKHTAESRYVEAILLNDEMLKDVAVKQFLRRKLKKSINDAKLGKVYADGFYHTVVGDMLGYLEFAAGKEPVGCLKAGEFFAKTLPNGPVLSFRSPLVDPSEVNAVSLVSNALTEKWFSYFKEQDIVMINMYDLSAPQQGGMDEDGDAVFLCSDRSLVSSKINKPIIIDIEDKASTGQKPYTSENLVQYEMMTRDNRIGEITNAATSIENKYTSDPEVKKRYADLASLLRLYQGKEIDYLKTGLRWHLTAGLKSHLKKLPRFLLCNYPTKQASDLFYSPSPMNELCDYIDTWERKHLIWDNTVTDTKHLLLNPEYPAEDKIILRKIRHLINAFSLEHRELLAEAEAENAEVDFAKTELLIAHYKEKLAQIEGITCEDELANYVIKVSYQNNSITKQLAWLGYGDYILYNLKNNSAHSKRTRITRVSPQTERALEYLGRYYLMKEEEVHEKRN